MPTRIGKGAYARGFLYHMPTRVPPQGSLFDGHVRSKWRLYIWAVLHIWVAHLHQSVPTAKHCYKAISISLWGWYSPFGSQPVGQTLVEGGLGKGLADGLDAYARPPRSLREPTRWNTDKSKNSIIRTGKKQLEIRETRPCVCNCWTLLKGNCDQEHQQLCINKLTDNLHSTSHLKNANEHLPTRLAYAKKIYIAFARAYARLRGLENIRSTAYATV